MNNLLRKITAGIVSATMILSGLGTFPTAMTDLFSYASSDDGGGETKDRSAKTEKFVAEKGNISKPVSDKWYILSVSTGTLDGNCCKDIVIEYVGNDGGNYTQVLTPGRSDFDTGGTFTTKRKVSTVTGNDEIEYLTVGSEDAYHEAYLKYSGSFYAGYSNVITNKSDYSTATTLDNTISRMLAIGNGNYGYYIDLEKDLFPDIQYFINEKTPYESNSTEDLLFASEHGIKTLSRVSFVCEANGQDSWTMNGWNLYSVTSDDLKNIMFVSPTFVTNRFRLDFKGTIIASATCSDPDLGFVNFGNFVFVPEGTAKNEQRTFKTHQLTVSYNIPSKKQYLELLLRTDTNFYNYYTYFRKQAEKEIDKRYDSYVASEKAEQEAAQKEANVSIRMNPAKILNFSINLKDVYGAGIETFNKVGSSNLKISEMLTACIEYTNSSGVVESVSLPVLTNAVLDACLSNTYAETTLRAALANGDLLSYAQQGESIVFSVAFEDFKELKSIELTYENPINRLDYIIIDDITVYDNCGDTTVAQRDKYQSLDLDSDNTAITFNVAMSGATMLYRTAYIPTGTTLEENYGTQKFDFKKASEVTRPSTDYSTKYLVTVNTSNVNFAGTASDIYASFDYKTLDGKTGTTEEYSFKEKSQDFYGYNPGVDSSGNVSDASYNYCVGEGGELKFLVDIPNLDVFTGMYLRLEDGATDDWQMDSVTVSRVYKVSRRLVEEDEDTFGGLTVNRFYDRTVQGEVLYSSDTKAYIQPNQKEFVDLDKGTFTAETERRNLSEYYYSMDYETASSELHFDESAYNYEVRVHVQSNSTAADANDDCGSNNLYYFQLLFEQGASGYVLANQQFNSDSFRAGQTETFYVSINEEMGDLTAINIIPDDMTEDSQALDKLCIDYIEVIKKNPDTANKRYLCENVGWINATYEDNAEETDREGRYVGELMTSVPVTSSGYMVSYEFAIAFDTYTNSGGTKSDQFEGGMTADIVYYTSSGERKVISDFNVVRAIAEYAARTPKSDETYGYITDSTYMFRESHINRFTVEISDVAYFESITLKGKPKTNCSLNIAGISIKLLKSDGSLFINNNGDFEKVYTIDPADITDEITGRTLPHFFNFFAGTYTNYTFNFGENSVPKIEDEESLRSIISREPQAANDTLNLYVYLQEGVPNPTDGKYTLLGKIYYSSVSTSNTYINECTKFKSKTENGREVVYAQGLSANNISMITNLKLTTPDLFNDPNIKVDYAVVEQVRAGVVINTYKIRFNSQMISMNGGVAMASKESGDALGYTQKVSLLLAEGTETARLVAEEYDIAVAIKYTSTTSGSGTELKSPYVFASDNDISSIQAGSFIEFNFTEAYVDQITGVEVIALNGLKVVVDSGNVVCRYSDDAGNINTNGWFSMGESAVISSGGTNLTITSNKAEDYNSLKRATISFTTMEKSEVIDSGGSAAIKMILSYWDNYGQTTEITIDDIRNSAKGGFAAGEEATLDFFLSGAKSFNYIQIIPYDTTTTSPAIWNLESVDFRLDGGSDSSTHCLPVNRTFYGGTDTYATDGKNSSYINISTMSMGIKRTINGESTYDETAEQTITIAAGTSLKLDVVFLGADSAYYGYFFDNVTGGNTSSITPYTETYGSLNYTFENSTADTQVYRYTVFSAKNPAVKTVLTINVAPEKIESDIPETPPVVDPSDNTDTDTNNTESNTTPADTPSGGNETTDSSTTEGNIASANGKKVKKKEEEINA